MTAKCNCPGAVCVCGAEGIVKDGSSVRVSSMMMDSAAGSQTLDELRAQSDAAYLASCRALQEDSRGADKQASPAPIADAKASAEKQVHDHAYADAREAGYGEDAAREHAARESASHRFNAWRG